VQLLLLLSFYFRTSEAKLNNFTRVEPSLHLLEISFDTNLARDVMNEKQGSAARLIYELFVALNKKKKKNLTGVAMETMRPAAPVKLDAISSVLYKEVNSCLSPLLIFCIFLHISLIYIWHFLHFCDSVPY
jgi:CH-like domain in sperm protein